MICDAVEDRVVSDDSTFQIAIPLTPYERGEYEDNSLKIAILLNNLNSPVPNLRAGNPDFLPKLQRLTESRNRAMRLFGRSE